jgi:hypothetical protein
LRNGAGEGVGGDTSTALLSLALEPSEERLGVGGDAASEGWSSGEGMPRIEACECEWTWLRKRFWESKRNSRIS